MRGGNGAVMDTALELCRSPLCFIGVLFLIGLVVVLGHAPPAVRGDGS